MFKKILTILNNDSATSKKGQSIGDLPDWNPNIFSNPVRYFMLPTQNDD